METDDNSIDFENDNDKLVWFGEADRERSGKRNETKRND